MAKGVQVWRWRSAQWVCVHRDHSRDIADPSEFGGRMGQAENDWLLVDVGNRPQPQPSFGPDGGMVSHNPAFGGSGAAQPKREWDHILQLSNADVPPGGTVWYWSSSRNDWEAIYHRSGVGSHLKPEVLEEIPGNDGEVVIETGDQGAAGTEEMFTIFRPGGIQEVVDTEVVAVLDSIEEGTGSSANPAFAMEAQAAVVDPPSTEERQAEEWLAVVDRMNASRPQLEEAERELRADPLSKKAMRLLKQVLIEATPSPTPGTTAIVDFPLLANEFVAAAQRDASFSSDHEGQLPGFRFVDKDGKTPDDQFGMAKNDVQIASLTSQALGALGAFVDYYEQLRKISEAYKDVQDDFDFQEADAVAGSAVATGSLDSVKGISGLLSATNTIANAVEKASQFAQATSAVSQGVPFVGTAVSLFTIGRVTRKTLKAGARRTALKDMLEQGAQTEDMQGVLTYMLDKTLRKTRVGKATIGTAVSGGAGGTILGVTAIVGGANIWNPIGWVLLGAAAVGGTGVVTYKIYRKYRRRDKRLQARRLAHIPVNAKEAANWLVRMARDDAHQDRAMAFAMLDIFGVSQADALNGSSDTIGAKIHRHLQHV